MLSFTTAFVVAAVAAGVFGAPTTDDPAQLAKRSSPNSSGTNNGFYYQFWTDGGGGSATYTNGAAGEYAVNWQGISDFTAGKGWQQAEPRNISFTGTFSASGNYYLSIYTWSGQGENYILEDYGDYNPCSQAQSQTGTLNSDGSDYQVCLVNRGNNYLQNWSVRKNKRSSGVVTTANHYNFYQAHGQTHNPLSAAAYQIVSSEGLGGGSGSCAITVADAGSGTTTGGSSPPPSSTRATTPASSPTGGSGSGACAAKYGQCGGQGFSGPTCCQAGSTCKASNQYYSQCL